MFDVRRFAVKKEIYLRKIYNSSHPCTDSIWEDASLAGNDQGASYGLDDAINNDSDFEDMKKQIYHMILKSRMRMNKIVHKGDKIRVTKSPIIYILCLVQAQEEAYSLSLSRL